MIQTCFLRPLVAACFFCSIAALGQPASSPPVSPGNNEQVSLAPDVRSQIDKAAADILKQTGVPSASIAIVQEGKLAYVHAYGMADVAAHQPATPAMRYSIGSISKQFTAAAILLLAEEGKLSLDDKVSRWLPDLTRAGDVTIREVLSMTAGYQDFWPQDYVMPGMLKPTSAQDILSGWARKPLDFEPGTKWQYSNTNYVIAGLIAERAAGLPLKEFLQQRIFDPLQMTSVTDTNIAALPPGDPQRYLRYGLGPVRPAPKEGAGWLFALAEIAMTATDLAKWDISMIDQTVLKPQSYREMQTEVLLRNGAGTRYGLGVGVSLANARRVISHGGEVSGFTAQNTVYPDEKAAVVVLTNLDATDASQNLTHKIADLLFAPTSSEGPLVQAKKIFARLQQGKIDRTLFTANANAYFTTQALQDLAHSLGSLGKPTKFTQTGEGSRGGMTFHEYGVELSGKMLNVVTYTLPDGKLEQYIVTAE